jgi:polysaccharide transporter, PST family
MLSAAARSHVVSARAIPADLQVGADMQTLKKQSVLGAASTFLAQGLRFVLLFGSQIALAHLLSPSDFGLVAMIAPVLTFVQIFNELGLSQATIQRAEITHEELSGLFWINTAISTALALIMGLCAPLVAWFYGQPHLTAICICIAALLVLSGLTSQQIALMNRRMRFTSLAAIDVSCSAVAIAVGIVSAWFGMGYWSLVMMQAANSVTILVMSWVLSDWRPSRPRRTEGIGSMLRFGGHLTGYNLINFAGSNLDAVLIGKVAGSVALGFYDRAFKLVAAPIWQISLPVDRIAVSLLSRLHMSGDQYRRAYLQMLQVLLLVTVPAVACVAMTSPVFVPIVLGRPWIEAAPIVTWLAVATAFAPFSISAYWLFVSQGRAGEQLNYVCGKTAISVAALLIGLPWGALGVARSYAAAAILVHGSLLWGATRRGPVNMRSILLACYPIAIGAAAAVAVLNVTQAQLDAIHLPAPQMLLAEVLLSYVVCGMTLLCTPGGLRIVRDLWMLKSTFARAPVAQ